MLRHDPVRREGGTRDVNPGVRLPGRGESWQYQWVDIELRYTVHQVPRGARPDAVGSGRWYLIKNVPLMRLTYQVRLLACMAQQNSARLVVILPPGARVSKDMRAYVRENAVTIQRANG
jgi:hypothetical protein